MTTPSKQVRKEIEELYLSAASIRRGAICLYPDLGRDLDKIQAEIVKLYDKTLTVEPVL